MDHAVDAAQIHKRAISGQGLDNAGVLLAFFCGLPELFRQGFALVTAARNGWNLPHDGGRGSLR